jgi:hypothetical protein
MKIRVVRAVAGPPHGASVPVTDVIYALLRPWELALG